MLLLLGEPLGINLGISLQEDGQGGKLILGVLGFRAVRLHLDDGAAIEGINGLDLIANGQNIGTIRLNGGQVILSISVDR